MLLSGLLTKNERVGADGSRETATATRSTLEGLVPDYPRPWRSSSTSQASSDSSSDHSVYKRFRQEFVQSSHGSSVTNQTTTEESGLDTNCPLDDLQRNEFFPVKVTGELRSPSSEAPDDNHE